MLPELRALTLHPATAFSIIVFTGDLCPASPPAAGGDAGHRSPVKTIMEKAVAGCKVRARSSGSITPDHTRASLDVSTSRFKLLRQDDAVRDEQLSRTEAQLRAT